MAVLGIDGCKEGWVGIVLDDGPPRALCASTVAELTAQAGAVDVVAIDIPIGLPVRGSRQADQLARRAVGPRRSSVFTTPPRAVLAAATYAEAAVISAELRGQGVSRQAFGLGPKILEVEAWIRSTDLRVVEVHPELSFAKLAGKFLPDPKSTWAGFFLRKQLLAGAGIVLDGDLGLLGRRVGPDDVLDAAVAAWSARRVVQGEAKSLPAPPEVLGDGVTAAIWY